MKQETTDFLKLLVSDKIAYTRDRRKVPKDIKTRLKEAGIPLLKSRLVEVGKIFIIDKGKFKWDFRSYSPLQTKDIKRKCPWLFKNASS